MTNNTRWISYHDVDEHPEASILLAYLRGQELKVRLSVRQHIDREKCPVCLQKLNQLQQVSTTLDVLGDMRSYQHYPELTVADTYARMQSAGSRHIPVKTAMGGVYDRQCPRKSAVRLISVPAAFGLAILFTMAMLVFANLSGRSFNPFPSIGGTSHSRNMLTVAVSPHSTPMQGASEAKAPHIEVCSTRANIAPLRLAICGSHFESMHKVTLVVYVPGKRSFWLRNIPVDKQGAFKIGWIMANCGDVPTSIYGYEETRSKPILVKLHIPAFGSCPAPTTTPIVKPSGFSPNFGKYIN